MMVVARNRMLMLTAWYGAFAIIGGCLALVVRHLYAGIDTAPAALGWLVGVGDLALPIACVGIGLRLHARRGSLPTSWLMAALATAIAAILFTWGVIQ